MSAETIVRLHGRNGYAIEVVRQLDKVYIRTTDLQSNETMNVETTDIDVCQFARLIIQLAE